MTGSTTGGTTVTHGFDALGFRRQRSASGVTTQYRLDGLFETKTVGTVQLTDVDGPAGWPP